MIRKLSIDVPMKKDDEKHDGMDEQRELMKIPTPNLVC
jgi:hypothetical protein